MYATQALTARQVQQVPQAAPASEAATTPLAPLAPLAALTISATDLVNHRAFLVRFAQRRLSDPVLAEDAVHDVFEAVISGRAVFAGRSAVRSWLTAVLKHKIVDIVRRRPMMDSLDGGDAGDDSDGAPMQREIECPHAGPAELAELRETLADTLDQIDTLPAGLRDAVRLRLIDDRETADVCQALAISEENLFVRLHRARKALVVAAAASLKSAQGSSQPRARRSSAWANSYCHS